MLKFQQTGSQFVPVLQATVEQYLEPSTGVRHIHVDTQQPELVFLVAFPTLPEIGDGRAHILEHLALCGSARYPVRNPFFAMMRRSTASFMNAMTYSDRTVYPFASTDKKDFFNLLDVYLDATFFPNLDPLSFIQEGWRYELNKEQNKLIYQGVVFNEMKGAFNSPMRALHAGINSTLFKDTTYAIESGGDPLVIPQLTYAMLKEFHSSQYHPSQAVFMTTGRLDAAEIQAPIIERVLSGLPGYCPRRLPQLVAPWTAPQENTVHIPSQTARDDEYGVQIAWLLGECADITSSYHASLLSAGLLGNTSAPIMRVLQSAGFGRPSSMNGHDNSARQMVFHIGMEGLTEDQIDDAEKMIWNALEETASKGIPTAVLQAALRDIRYNQRNTSGGWLPPGLARLLSALPVELVNGDVLAAFDNDAILDTLQRQIEDPGFFKSLVQFLLDSPTRLTTRVMPDAAFFSVRQASEDASLAATLTNMSATERQRVLDETSALDLYQQLPSNADVLPRIRPSDVNPLPRPLFPPSFIKGNGSCNFSIASNGISYANVLFDVSALPESTWPWLNLYAEVVPNLGVWERSFEETDMWRQNLVPTFSINLEVNQKINEGLCIEMAFFASGLREDAQGIADVLSESICNPRFNESARLAFLINSLVQQKLTSLGEAGQRYAKLAATAPLSAIHRFEDIIGGSAALPFYKMLRQWCETPEGLQAISQRLKGLHVQIISMAPTIICAGVFDDAAELSAMLRLPSPTVAPVLIQCARFQALTPANVALHATSQTNHCWIAWAAPNISHADAGALAVTAEMMSNQVLHTALREKGGAYSGSASYEPDAGVFSMSSYRDPRLAATYADFDAAINWIADSEFSYESIEEAIICVIKKLDKPYAPYADAINSWNLVQRGITEDIRRAFRTRVLQCSAEDIKRVTRTWLINGIASRAAFAGNMTQDLAGLTAVDLMALAT